MRSASLSSSRRLLRSCFRCSASFALSQRRVFHGVAVSVKTSPPRIRLPENEGDGSFQLLLALPQEQKLPDWVVPLRRAGYPVVRGDQLDAGKLLRWVRLLQTH